MNPNPSRERTGYAVMKRNKNIRSTNVIRMRADRKKIHFGTSTLVNIEKKEGYPSSAIPNMPASFTYFIPSGVWAKVMKLLTIELGSPSVR